MLIAAAATLLLLFYLMVDPSESGWVPQCIFLKVTGLQCPGCGAQRMAHAVLHGDLAEAWSYNPFLLIMLPLLIFMGWLELRRDRYPRLYAGFHSVPVIIVLASAVVAWFLLRNFIL